MPHFAEFVSFIAADVDDATLLARREAAIRAVRAAHPALLQVPVLARRDDGSWIDVWIYETREAAEAANAGAGEIPEFLDFASLLTDVDIVGGTVPAGSVDPTS